MNQHERTVALEYISDLVDERNLSYWSVVTVLRLWSEGDLNTAIEHMKCAEANAWGMHTLVCGYNTLYTIDDEMFFKTKEALVDHVLRSRAKSE